MKVRNAEELNKRLEKLREAQGGFFNLYSRTGR